MVMKRTEIIWKCSVHAFYPGPAAVWSNLGQRARGKDRLPGWGPWTCLQRQAQFPSASPFCIFSLRPPFTGVLSLPAFKGSCHCGTQPGRREVGKIKKQNKPFLAWNAVWDVLDNQVVNDNCHQNLLFQMHFSVSRPERSCTLKFRMVGCLCDWRAGISKSVQARRNVHLCI